MKNPKFKKDQKVFFAHFEEYKTKIEIVETKISKVNKIIDIDTENFYYNYDLWCNTSSGEKIFAIKKEAVKRGGKMMAEKINERIKEEKRRGKTLDVTYTQLKRDMNASEKRLKILLNYKKIYEKS